MPKHPPDVSPIVRSISVSWPQAHAFRHFVADFGSWWPKYTHSIGGRRVRRVVLECHVGGAIYEEHRDGTRYTWGTVTALDDPHRIAFTFHASYAERDAQQVEITFTPESTGTRVQLVSSGWENMAAHPQRSRGGYRIGWSAILDRYASRFSREEMFFYAMAWMIDGTGQRSTFMRNSLGRVPGASP